MRRSGKLCTIRDCYLDDSKDKHQEFSYVCAGFYGEQMTWGDFSERWRKQLKEEGIDYFKSSECNSLTGQFIQWRSLAEPYGRMGADQIRERLQKIARGTQGLWGVGVAVPVEDHEAVLKYENARLVFPEGRVYERAFETTLLHSVRTACTNPRDLMVFVHDSGTDFGDLLKLFNAFKTGNRNSSTHLASLLPMDDKETPALQLADMFSNALQSTSTAILRGNKDGNSVSEIFMLDRSNVAVWDRDVGEQILWGNLKQRGLPIPDDLNATVLARRPDFLEKWDAGLLGSKRSSPSRQYQHT